jgi:hypothetical protein
MTTGLINKISRAITIKVYGRLRASLTIHIKSELSAVATRGTSSIDPFRYGQVSKIALMFL